MAPEALAKSSKEINLRAADMWSFAVLLWEMATREEPFRDLAPMEAGMKVSGCFSRVDIFQVSPDISSGFLGDAPSK